MDEPLTPLPSEILSHYESAPEETRLTRGSGALEFIRSQELIERWLPPPPRIILDVGGGPGAYACWLAQKGYEVHLIDPVPKHLEQARIASSRQSQSPIASVREGDARSLQQANQSCHAVLLLGPLYHLTSSPERARALAKAHRVLKPAGLVFAAGVNRFASLLDGLQSGFIDDPYFMKILRQDLVDGQHRNPKNAGDYWTTAILHRPKELESEVGQAGFKIVEVAAIQGPGWLTKDLANRLTDPRRRELLLELIRQVEHEPSLMGMSTHFMVIGQK